MSTIEDEDILNNFKSPEIYLEKLQVLKQQLPALLTDFKKYYIFFNKNPEFPEYQNMFNNIKNNLTKLGSDLFMLSNDISASTDEINKKLFALNILIHKEKKRNRELKIKLGIIENKSDASSELISDYKKIYSMEYLRNWGLFLSILLIGVSISKINKIPVT